MAASTETKLQLSLKVGNDMLNVYATNAHEMESLVEEARKQPEMARFFKTETAEKSAVPDYMKGVGSVPTPVVEDAGPGPAADAEKSAATGPVDPFEAAKAKMAAKKKGA